VQVLEEDVVDEGGFEADIELFVVEVVVFEGGFEVAIPLFGSDRFEKREPSTVYLSYLLRAFS
jgi:hypothetical protein